MGRFYLDDSLPGWAVIEGRRGNTNLPFNRVRKVIGSGGPVRKVFNFWKPVS